MSLRNIVKGLCEKTKCYFDVYTKHYIDEEIYTKDKVDSKLANKSDVSHTHDNRYYTESEMDTKLDGKSNTSHNHDDRYFTEAEINSKLTSYKVKGDFAILTGSLNAGNETAINFPSGFTKDNCVVIATQFQNPNKTDRWGIGTNLDSSNMFGTIPHKIVFTDKITITARNVGASSTGITEPDITVNMRYKVILMKV